MTVQEADIELYIVDLGEKFGMELNNVRFQKTVTRARIVDGKIRYDNSPREILVLLFDIFFSEESREYLETFRQRVEDYIKAKDIEFAVVGKFYIRS